KIRENSFCHRTFHPLALRERAGVKGCVGRPVPHPPDTALPGGRGNGGKSCCNKLCELNLAPIPSTGEGEGLLEGVFPGRKDATMPTTRRLLALLTTDTLARIASAGAASAAHVRPESAEGAAGLAPASEASKYPTMRTIGDSRIVHSVIFLT